VFNSLYKGHSKVVVVGVYELRPTTASGRPGGLCKGHSKVLAIKQQQQQPLACGGGEGEARVTRCKAARDGNAE
jgi:hypothetical protein